MEILKRYKFWLAVGAAVLFGVVLFVFVWIPQAGQAGEDFQTLQSRADELERMVRGEMVDQEWIEREEERKEALERALEQMRAEIRDHYPDVGVHFDDPQTGDEGPIEFWRFRRIYERRMQELAERVRDSMVRVGREDFLVKHALSDFKPIEELHIFEREYWVQRAILEVLIEQNEELLRVPIFHDIAINRPRADEAERERPSRTMRRARPDEDEEPTDRTEINPMNRVHKESDLFDIWPFEVEVTLPFRYLNDLLWGFANSPYRLEVVSFDVERRHVEWTRAELWPGLEEIQEPRERTRRVPEDAFRPERFTERREEEDEYEPDRAARRLPDEVVRVLIRGYLPEFKGYDEGDS